MTDQILQQRAHEAAIDHGMWLAPDDDETNYEAFVAGYLRGHSDMAAKTTNALDELDDWRESARKAEQAEIRLPKVREFLSLAKDGWFSGSAKAILDAALAELDAVEGKVKG